MDRCAGAFVSSGSQATWEMRQLMARSVPAIFFSVMSQPTPSSSDGPAQSGEAAHR